jgi:hypothetical protein
VTPSTYTIEPIAHGRMRIIAHFVDGQPIQIRNGLSGLRAIPAGWQANIKISTQQKLDHELWVTPFPGDSRRLDAIGHVQFAKFACDGFDQPLSLWLASGTGWMGTETIELEVEATLALSSCIGG